MRPSDVFADPAHQEHCMPSRSGKWAFVAMPFAEGFDELYQNGIVGAAADAGLELIRLSRLPVAHIVEQMKAGIDRADLVIAVVTGRNPHVFFEVALAFAARKPCIIMADKEEDFEIFQEEYPCLIYDSSIANLRRSLGKEIGHLLSG
jgi:hypothetical protein